MHVVDNVNKKFFRRIVTVSTNRARNQPFEWQKYGESTSSSRKKLGGRFLLKWHSTLTIRTTTVLRLVAFFSRLRSIHKQKSIDASH